MSAQNERYRPLGGQILGISDSAVEHSGLKPGAEYDFVAIGGIALCRWDTTAAAAATGSFTFAVSPGERLRVMCPTGNSLLNIIEASADSSATAVLVFTEVLPA